VWVTGGSRRRVNQENPPMRTYIIGNDGITLCREAPATLNDGEVVVASREELHAAPLSGKRLLALWNALPGVEKRRTVGDRKALIDRATKSCFNARRPDWNGAHGLRRMNLPWDRATFSWDDTEVIFVTRDDGQIAPVLGVLSNVMAMWDAEFARVSL
jgi:hypothetical protein